MKHVVFENGVEMWSTTISEALKADLDHEADAAALPRMDFDFNTRVAAAMAAAKAAREVKRLLIERIIDLNPATAWGKTTTASDAWHECKRLVQALILDGEDELDIRLPDSLLLN